MSTIQVAISLASDGRLQLELPAVSEGTRQIPMKPGFEVDCITRVLLALSASAGQIGEDGAPTAQQVRHWQSHQVFPDDRCPFCRSEALLSASLQALRAGEGKKQVRVALRELGGGVTVRKIKPGQHGTSPVSKSKKSAASLGL